MSLLRGQDDTQARPMMTRAWPWKEEDKCLSHLVKGFLHLYRIRPLVTGTSQVQATSVCSSHSAKSCYNVELFSNQAAYLLQNKERQSRVKEAKAGAERGDDEG